MSLMVDPEYNWFFGIIAGSNWPQGDEDKLRALAADWDGVAADLGRAGEGFGPLSKEITGSVGGTVGRNFVRFGHKLGSYQGDFAQSAAGQARLLRQQALNVENAKYSILIQIAFTAWEIISALADPFTAPLVPEIILEGQLAVRTLMKRFFGRTSSFVRAAISEGIEEVVQDALAQLIQIAQHNRDGVDWGSLGVSAGFGAGAGAFGHGVHKGLAKYDPKFANSWKGAAATEAITELGIGLGTLPFGGDADGLGWSVLNGGLSGAATHAAHLVHHKDTPDQKVPAVPKGPNTDGDNLPTDFEPPPPYVDDRPPSYQDNQPAKPSPSPSPTPAPTPNRTTSAGTPTTPAPTPTRTPSPQANPATEVGPPTTQPQPPTTATPEPALTETPTHTPTPQPTPTHTPAPDTAPQPTPTQAAPATQANNANSATPEAKATAPPRETPSTEATSSTATKVAPAATQPTETAAQSTNKTATNTTTTPQPSRTPTQPDRTTPTPDTRISTSGTSTTVHNLATPSPVSPSPGSSSAKIHNLATSSPTTPNPDTSPTRTTPQPSRTPDPTTKEPTRTEPRHTRRGPVRTELNFDADLTHRTNRELRRLGRDDIRLSQEDITEMRAQRAGKPLARDVVGLSNQLAQVAIIGDVVRLRGGVYDPNSGHGSISFNEKQTGSLSTEQRQEVAEIARASADLLVSGLPTQQLHVRVTGYGNGEFSLLDKDKTRRTAEETGRQRAGLVADALDTRLAQELGSRPGPLSVPQDVRIERVSAGRGGAGETDTTRRRADVDVRLVPRDGRTLRFARPSDLRAVPVPDRELAMRNDIHDPTLPMRTVLDRLGTQSPPDRHTTQDPRPRLRLDEVLRRDQRWLAYIDPYDHATAQERHPDDPGGYYANNFAAAMGPAVDRNLQGDGIDVSRLDWNSYRRLYAEVTNGVEGDRFVRTGTGRQAGFAMRTPVPAPDILTEHIGGRRLMSHTLDDAPLTQWARDDNRGHTSITTQYAGRDASDLVNEIFDRFRGEIAEAGDDHARLIAIARAVRALHVLHLHRDGNGRLNVYILLPRLLMEYGFHPLYLDHGDSQRRAVLNSVGALFNGGYTVEQIATAIEFLQPPASRFDRTYGAETAQGRPPAPDTGDAVFGTPADQEPARQGETRKRPAEQDADTDTDRAKRPRVLDVLPGSAQDAVLSGLHDVRRDATGGQDTPPPSRPWAFTEPGQAPGEGRPRVLSRDTFPEHSLEPIRYLREHHPDLIGLNAVRYHAAHPDYLVNCVNVAVSVSETLNGHRHVPLPASGPRRGSLIEQHFGRPVRPLADPDGIVDALVTAGPGAHGIVFDIGPDGHGHVFTALYDAGTNDIVLLDVQSGRFAAVRADHTYGFLLTSGPTGDTVAPTPFSHHDFGAPSGANLPGPETVRAPNTSRLPGPLLVTTPPTDHQLDQVRALATQAAAATLDHLHHTGRRAVITMTSHGPLTSLYSHSVRAVVNSAVQRAFAERRHLAPRELDADEDVSVRHVTDQTGPSRIEISVGTEPHPSPPSLPTFPRSGPFTSDPTAGTRDLLDDLHGQQPPDATPRRPLPPLGLDQVLWRSQRWLAYISPDNHQEAVATRPGNPGGMYRDDFQQPMDAAVVKILQNGVIDDRLSWRTYKSLHRDVVAGAQGSFRRTGHPAGAGYSLRTPEPAADILTERLGNRPLMSDDPADNPLTRWRWSDDHRSAIAETRYTSDDTGALVDEVFDRMYAELAAADTDNDRLIAIARAVRALHVLHPYLDGNGRLNVFVLLPHLLMRHGFRPMYVGDNDTQREILLAMGALFNGGYTLDQIATAIRMFQPPRTDDDSSDEDSPGDYSD